MKQQISIFIQRMTLALGLTALLALATGTDSALTGESRIESWPNLTTLDRPDSSAKIMEESLNRPN